MLNAVPLSDSTPVLHVLYGSHTGNGEGIAARLGQQAGQAGFAVKVQSLLQFKPAQLSKIEYAVFIISTHGEGDPPDDALDLFEFLRGPRAGRLRQLRFHILALGDSSYVKFCEAGRELEQRLVAAGAAAFAERVECDLDFSAGAARFGDDVIEFCQQNLEASEVDTTSVSTSSPAAPVPHLSVVPERPLWTRDRPFPATIESVRRITAGESDKDVRHVTVSMEGSGLAWQPGDSLGVWAPNDPSLVQEVLKRTGLDADYRLEYNGAERSLRDWLTERFEITRLTPATVRGWAQLCGNPGLVARIEGMDEKALSEFIGQRQLADLAQAWPAQPSAEALVALLRPLAPRSYSIASSREATGDELHLTVVTHHSNANGHGRNGLASSHLNRRLQPGDEVGVFLEPNTRFRLPENETAPLILVAAGTGVAPYRAFLQELEERGRSPRSWLIFGNPRLQNDFLYQNEWLGWRRAGLLERIDTAFSRDQAEKRYVQHVIREQSQGISEWLEWGAHLYLCGSLAMGAEVEQALIEGLAEYRGLDIAAAGEVLSSLRREQRLHKDLY